MVWSPFLANKKIGLPVPFELQVDNTSILGVWRPHAVSPFPIWDILVSLCLSEIQIELPASILSLGATKYHVIDTVSCC